MKIYLVPVCFLFLSAPFLQAQNDLKTVATVSLTKTEPITVKMLKEQVKQVEAALGQPLNAAMRREVLDGMINEKLALQAAEKEKIIVTDAELNQQLNGLRAQMAQILGRNPTDAEFNNALKQQTGMEPAAYREQARKLLTVQKYLLAKKQNVLSSIKDPTEADIVKEYDLNSSELIQPETLEFSAIVFPVANDAERNRKREEANKLLNEIGNSPENFDEKLQRGKAPNAGYNVAQRSILQKNAAGQQRAGQAFMDDAFALAQGKISKVLEIPSGQARGFYIIKVTAKYPKKFLGLDDTHLVYGETVRAVLREAIMQKRQQEILEQAQRELVDELRKDNPYKIFEENLNY
ncbi:MAG: SurA N-terminal domain-containing protein [Spirochaetaceae bacterium]|jgi:parvulin-like peptidyl-prolyl isomerase|nr:SurA N-terminal domain-containing protein [Spirochaetaceae bacterium]